MNEINAFPLEKWVCGVQAPRDRVTTVQFTGLLGLSCRGLRTPYCLSLPKYEVSRYLISPDPSSSPSQIKLFARRQGRLQRDRAAFQALPSGATLYFFISAIYPDSVDVWTGLFLVTSQVEFHGRQCKNVQSCVISQMCPPKIAPGNMYMLNNLQSHIN